MISSNCDFQRGRAMMFTGSSVWLFICGVFYAVLCIFSIVTGLIYMSGKRQLNPIELSDRFMEKLSDPEKRRRFTVRMGAVTFIVGIIQGITAYSLFRCGSPLLYWIAFGFNAFSICSVLLKLKGKINAFPLLKLIAYTGVLIVLLTGTVRSLYF